jgi:hypothetical protein
MVRIGYGPPGWQAGTFTYAAAVSARPIRLVPPHSGFDSLKSPPTRLRHSLSVRSTRHNRSAEVLGCGLCRHPCHPFRVQSTYLPIDSGGLFVCTE